jgi:hypothetical protein
MGPLLVVASHSSARRGSAGNYLFGAWRPRLPMRQRLRTFGTASGGTTTQLVQVLKAFDSRHAARVGRNYCFNMKWRLFLLTIAAIALGAQGQVVTQTSTVQGVTIAATAGNLGPDTTVWDFAVVLDSRNQELPDDLVENAVLLDDSGHAHKALVWEGAPAEGRHRAGVLKFFAPDGRPQWVELRITRPGEARPRTFSWFVPGGLVALR